MVAVNQTFDNKARKYVLFTIFFDYVYEVHWDWKVANLLLISKVGTGRQINLVKSVWVYEPVPDKLRVLVKFIFTEVILGPIKIDACVGAGSTS